MPTPLGAAARSTFLPGWGQWAVGHRRLGSLLAGVWTLGLGACAVAAWTIAPGDLVVGLTDTRTLAALAAANLLVVGIRIATTSHAWWAAGGRPLGIGLVALVVIATAPHVWVGASIAAAQRTVATVFVAPPRPTTGAVADTTPSPTTDTRGETAPRVTVLLAGADAGPGRTGIRTDTVIVATIDPVSGDAVLFGLPRNLAGLETTDGRSIPGILNEVVGRVAADPADPGVATGMADLVDVAGHLLGLSIDHWALVDLTGFGRIVDALGGVTVTLPDPMDIPLWDPTTGRHRTVEVPAGTQHLDGDHALGYVRSRTGTSDYDRMARQRCLLGALATQVDPASLVLRLPRLLDTVAANFQTDIPAERHPDLVRLATEVDLDRMLVVGFDPAWAAGRTLEGYPVADRTAVRDAVFQAVADLDLATDLSGIPPASEVC